MTRTTGLCAQCRTVGPIGALLRITARGGGSERLLCRPSVRVACFRYGTAAAGVETVELADPVEQSRPFEAEDRVAAAARRAQARAERFAASQRGAP